MSTTKKKIQTYDTALESVHRDDQGRYELGRSRPLGVSGRLPAIIYDPDTDTVWSKGSKRHDAGDVLGHRFEGFHVGSPHTAEGTEKRRMQRKRATALIRHARSDA